MTSTFQRIAEAATFRSFANGYLREIDAGIRVHHALTDGPPAACVEWTLRAQRLSIRAEIASPSLCGSIGFDRLWTRHLHEPRWRLIAPMRAIQELLGEAYARVDGGLSEDARERELELLSRIMDSYRETVRALDLTDRDPGQGTNFIDAERAIVFGHWLHPTPKSRQGLTAWQSRAYAPEGRGEFQLTVFAAATERVRHDSACARSAPDIARDLLGSDADRLLLRDGEIALPMHPLQAEALMLEPHIQAMEEAGLVRRLGSYGPHFTATSSLRTVYGPGIGWMAKFSLPVTLTNSVRVNRMGELEAGVAMARLLAHCGLGGQWPAFRVIADPAYLTLSCPDRAESGFETVLRENPFCRGAERGIATLGALTSEPPPGRPSRLEALLRRVCGGGAAARAQAARDWFGRYLDCMLEPVVALYDAHGIALEAHQQNALLDVADGWPRRGFYRDNQGYYLSEDAKLILCRLVPELSGIDQLFFPDSEIRRRLAYYLVINQIFSVVARMGHDGIVREGVLLDDFARRLEGMAWRLTGRGRAFARSILDSPTLCTKANLRVRLSNRDELAAGDGTVNYIDMPNPLGFRQASHTEVGRANAS